MLKLKNYKLESNIHVYQQKDLHIAYDVNSGSLHLLDKKAFQLIQEMQEIQRLNPDLLEKDSLLLEEIGGWLEQTEKDEILEELGQLQEDGTLFSPVAENMNCLSMRPP
jgi:uncharacterized protein